jgi:hypothetical protein
MKKQLLLTSFIFLSLSAFPQLKIDKQHYVDLLNQGRYDLVYDEMIALQKKPYGKCCLTDFFIAKTLCLSGIINPAQSRYKSMLTNYKLSEKAKTFVEKERINCTAPTDVSPQESFGYINNYPLPTSSVRGKLGAVYNCYQSFAPVKTIREISDEEFASRVFSLEDSKNALLKIKSIIPESYIAESKGRFIWVTSKTQKTTADAKNKMATELEKTLKFYSSFYKLRLPDKIFTVYIVPNNELLRNIAYTMHGLVIPKENYGYSILSDLSLVGISSTVGIGTIKHELFHLMVRADVGDIPAWLDEGIATLYEESHWNQNTLISDKTFWRTKTLRQALTSFHLFSKFPDLQSLLNYSWSEFDGTDDEDICKASVNYAFAKHLVVYLEQTGQLKAMLNAYKNKETGNKGDLVKTNSEIFIQATNRPLYETEKLFDKWLQEKYYLSFLDPEVHGPPDVDELLIFKKKLHQIKRISDSLHKVQSPEAPILEKFIFKTESSFKFLSKKFDSNMKDVLLSKPNNYESDRHMYQSLFEYSKGLKDLNSKLIEAIESFENH